MFDEMTGCRPHANASQTTTAGPGRAISQAHHAKMIAPAPTKCEGQSPSDDHSLIALAADHATTAASPQGSAPDPQPHPGSDAGETTAIPRSDTENPAPSSRPSPKGARAAKRQAKPLAVSPHVADDHGHFTPGALASCAVIDDGDGQDAPDTQLERAVPVHPLNASPLVAEIVETWRQRQAMVEARKRLVLQAKALCRRMTAGDKAAADAIFDAGDSPILAPFYDAMQPFETRQAALDRHMVKLAKGLPVAEFAMSVKGFGLPGLAKAVGELGDLSCYQKGVAGIWKRAGLAVIDGQRQRRVTGDAALVHGYAPARRSVFWNVAAAILKGQGTGDASGPYRLIYDERKAYEAPRVESAAHAHNRALRYMTKRLLRDLWRAWPK